jgi:cbb3-type cytochrome oxidase subunit 3
MTSTLFSLLTITLGFSALILWVFWPSRRKHLESLGQIPLEEIPLEEIPEEAHATLTPCKPTPKVNR